MIRSCGRSLNLTTSERILRCWSHPRSQSQRSNAPTLQHSNTPILQRSCEMVFVQIQMLGYSHHVEKGQRMKSLLVRLALLCMMLTLAASTHGQPLLLKTETFNTDPGWDGTNNRATDPGPRQIVQNFGFS